MAQQNSEELQILKTFPDYNKIPNHYIIFEDFYSRIMKAYRLKIWLYVEESLNGNYSVTYLTREHNSMGIPIRETKMTFQNFFENKEKNLENLISELKLSDKNKLNFPELAEKVCEILGKYENLNGYRVETTENH